MLRILDHEKNKMSWSKEGLLTIGDIRKRIAEKERKYKRQRTTSSSSSSSSSSRHVTWKYESNYKCVRNGSISFENESQLDEAFQSHRVQESWFWIYRHKDMTGHRNQETPIYEALYKCNGRFIIVQKKHLCQAYKNAKRNDTSKMDEIMERDGSPYWVDRYYCKNKK